MAKSDQGFHGARLAEMAAVKARFAETEEMVATAEKAREGYTDETVMPHVDIVVLDISSWARPTEHDQHERVAAVETMVGALESLGFLLIKGHGVPEVLVEEVMAAGLSLFRLPREARKALHPRHYGLTRRGIEFASFNLGPPDDSLGNVWPEATGELAGFRSVMTRYYAEMERVSSVLLRMMSFALGCEDPEALSRANGKHRGLLAFNYSPSSGERKRSKDRPHTDWGPLTILRPGPYLELISKDEWREMPLIPETFVVNVGDIMERFSNGRFKSTVHVIRRWDDEERISVPYFAAQALDPSDDLPVAPFCRLGEASKYPQISQNEFIANYWEYFRGVVKDGTFYGGTSKL